MVLGISVKLFPVISTSCSFYSVHWLLSFSLIVIVLLNRDTLFVFLGLLFCTCPLQVPIIIFMSINSIDLGWLKCRISYDFSLQVIKLKCVCLRNPVKVTTFFCILRSLSKQQKACILQSCSSWQHFLFCFLKQCTM